MLSNSDGCAKVFMMCRTQLQISTYTGIYVENKMSFPRREVWRRPEKLDNWAPVSLHAIIKGRGGRGSVSVKKARTSFLCQN